MATGEAFESSQHTEMKSVGKDGWPKCLLLINIQCTKTSQHAPWRCALTMSIFQGHSFFTLHLFIVCEKVTRARVRAVCVCVVCTWRSEDNLRASVLSHHGALGIELAKRLEDKHLSLLSHLLGLSINF